MPELGQRHRSDTHKNARRLPGRRRPLRHRHRQGPRDREPRSRSPSSRTRRARWQAWPIIEARSCRSSTCGFASTWLARATRAGASGSSWFLGGRTVGLAVDSVTDVFGARADDIKPTPEVGGNGDLRGISGVASLRRQAHLRARDRPVPRDHRRARGERGHLGSPWEISTCRGRPYQPVSPSRLRTRRRSRARSAHPKPRSAARPRPSSRDSRSRRCAAASGMRALGDEDWRVRKEGDDHRARLRARASARHRAPPLAERRDRRGPSQRRGRGAGGRWGGRDGQRRGSPAQPGRRRAEAGRGGAGSQRGGRRVGSPRSGARRRGRERARRRRRGPRRARRGRLGPGRGDPLLRRLASSGWDRSPVLLVAALEGLTAMGVAAPWSVIAPILAQPSAARLGPRSSRPLREPPEAARAVARVLLESSAGAVGNPAGAPTPLQAARSSTTSGRDALGALASPESPDIVAVVPRGPRGRAGAQLTGIASSLLHGLRRSPRTRASLGLPSSPGRCPRTSRMK